MFVLAGMVPTANAVELSNLRVTHAFYAALGNTDIGDAIISEIVSDDLVVELRDLGITQNRDEFLESLPQVREALEEKPVTHRIMEVGEGVIVVTACYEFNSNDFLARETVSFTDNLISTVVQEELSDDCAAMLSGETEQ